MPTVKRMSDQSKNTGKRGKGLKSMLDRLSRQMRSMPYKK